MSQPAVSHISDDDNAWLDLAKELTPSKSLARIEAATARTVTTVTIIGTLLTGFGVFGATLFPENGALRIMTIVAIALAISAIVCALLAQVASIKRNVNINNLDDVERWYNGIFRWRAPLAKAATYLLLAGSLVAGVAAVLGLLSAPSDLARVSVTQTLAPSGAETSSNQSEQDNSANQAPNSSVTVAMDVSFRGLNEDDFVVASISDSTQVYARAAFGPSVDGTATQALTAKGLPSGVPIIVKVQGGQWVCEGSFGLEASQDDSPLKCQRN